MDTVDVNLVAQTGIKHKLAYFGASLKWKTQQMDP